MTWKFKLLPKANKTVLLYFSKMNAMIKYSNGVSFFREFLLQSSCSIQKQQVTCRVSERYLYFNNYT